MACTCPWARPRPITGKRARSWASASSSAPTPAARAMPRCGWARQARNMSASAFPEFVGDMETARARRLDLIAWWAEIFEVPCVAFDVETAAGCGGSGARRRRFRRRPPCVRLWRPADVRTRLRDYARRAQRAGRMTESHAAHELAQASSRQRWRRCSGGRAAAQGRNQLLVAAHHPRARQERASSKADGWNAVPTPVKPKAVRTSPADNAQQHRASPRSPSHRPVMTARRPISRSTRADTSRRSTWRRRPPPRATRRRTR